MDHQLNVEGTCAPGANPWLKQFAEDVTCAMRIGILLVGAVFFTLVPGWHVYEIIAFADTLLRNGA